MTSLPASASVPSFLPASPAISMHTPNSNVKEMICNISPLANAVTGFDGKSPMMISDNGGASLATTASAWFDSRSKPAPGFTIVASPSAMEIASAVVPR